MESAKTIKTMFEIKELSWVFTVGKA